MNSTEVFDTFSSPLFQFLSVCHYVSTIGLILSNQRLVSPEEANQSISVLNGLFDYLNKSNNEIEAKKILLQQVLNGTDLYGGGQNETLDEKYVNEIYHRIVDRALFKHYGGIIGYLATIVVSLTNDTISSFTKQIFYHLNNEYIGNNYCSIKDINSSLTLLSITKIMEDYIIPIFPPSESNISIFDVDYMYAMAGLKMSEASNTDVKDNSLDYYVTIARTLEMVVHENSRNSWVLEAFSTPALLYYTFNQRPNFSNQNTTSLNKTFWNHAYEMLFAYLTSTTQKIVQEALDNNLEYKFMYEMSKSENRTQMAVRFLKETCRYRHLISHDQFDSFISWYKTGRRLFQLNHFVLCENSSNIPDLEEEFVKQFIPIKKAYLDLMIERTLEGLEEQGIKNIIDSQNSTVFKADVGYDKTVRGCTRKGCYNLKPNLSSNTVLIFAIEKENEVTFYAMIKNESAHTLHVTKETDPFFKLDLNIEHGIKMSKTNIVLKGKDEDSKSFSLKVAKILAEKFVEQLESTYREEVLTEKIIEFFKYAVPFYSCVNDFKEGDPFAAQASCSMDVLSLILFAKSLMTFGAVAKSSIGFTLQRTFSVVATAAKGGVSVRNIMKSLMYTLRSESAKMLDSGIFLKVTKNLALETVSLVDPGVQLSYNILRYGPRAIFKFFKILSDVTRLLPHLRKFAAGVKLLSKSLMLKTLKSSFSDNMRMIPVRVGTFKQQKVVRYVDEVGKEFIGPTCIKTGNEIAELRTIPGKKPFQIFAVSSKNADDKLVYQPLDLKTGEKGHMYLNVEDPQDNLRRRVYNFALYFKQMGTEDKILRDYQVYHFTMETNQPSAKEILRRVRHNPGEQNLLPHSINRGDSVDHEISDVIDKYLEPDPVVDAQQNDNFNYDKLLENLGDFPNDKTYPKQSLNQGNNNQPTTFDEILNNRDALNPVHADDSTISELYEGPSTSKGVKNRLKNNGMLISNEDITKVPAKRRKTQTGHESGMMNLKQSDSKLLSTSEYAGLDLPFQGTANDINIDNYQLKELDFDINKYFKDLEDFQNSEMYPRTKSRNPLEQSNSNFPRTLEDVPKKQYAANSVYDDNLIRSNIRDTFDGPATSNGKHGFKSTGSLNTMKDISNVPAITKETYSIYGRQIINFEQSNPKLLKTFQEFLNNNKNPLGLVEENRALHLITEDLSLIPGSSRDAREFGILNVPEKPAEIDLVLAKYANSINKDYSWFSFKPNKPNEKLKRLANELIFINLKHKVPPSIKDEENVALILRIAKTQDLAHFKANKHIKKFISHSKSNFGPEKCLEFELNLYAIQQKNRNFINKPLVLWFQKFEKKIDVVEVLNELQGQNFFFNNIVFATKKVPSSFAQVLENFDATDTLISYRMEINNPYRILDTNLVYGTTFPDGKYAIFPDTNFKVIGTRLSLEKRVLIVDLREEPIDEITWLFNKASQIDSIITETGKLKRLQIIEESAEIISSNVPFFTKETAGNILKSYSLTFDLVRGSHYMPSMKDFVEEFTKNLRISGKYGTRKMQKAKYFDDVLHRLHLNKGDELKYSEEKVRHLYGTTQGEYLDEIITTYKSRPVIQKDLTLEDYHIIKSVMDSRLNPEDPGIAKLYKNAISRLSVRQFANSDTTRKITLHGFKELNWNIGGMEDLNLRSKQVYKFKEVQFAVYTMPDMKYNENLLNANSKNMIYYTFTLKSHLGAVNIQEILSLPYTAYLLHPSLKWRIKKVTGTYETNIFLKLYSTVMRDESAMMDLIESFEEI